MVTLASVRPEDLVPGFGETAAGINRLAQDIKLGRAQSQFFDPASTKQQKMEAFGRISSLNPQFGQVLLQSMERQDKQQQRQIQQTIRTNLNRMALIDRQPNFAKKQATIKREIEKAIVGGEDPAQLLELFDMDEAALKQEIQTAKIIATDVDKLFEVPEAPESPFAKPKITDFTRESVAAFQKGGGTNPSVLRRVALPASAIGKEQDDRRTLVENFGEGSQRVQQFDAAIAERDKTIQTTLIRNLKAAGINPKSPEGLKIIRDNLTRAAVNINLSKPEPGFTFVDPNDPSKGVIPIPGGSRDPLTVEKAAKNSRSYNGARRI